MEHTSLVFLMQGDGTFMSTVDRNRERDAALTKLPRLLGNGPALTDLRDGGRLTPAPLR